MALFACIKQQNKIMLTTKILTSNLELELEIQIALGRSSRFLVRILGVLGHWKTVFYGVSSASILHSLKSAMRSWYIPFREAAAILLRTSCSLAGHCQHGPEGGPSSAS